MEKKGIARAAVIAAKDEKWGERPLALLILQPEFVGKITAEDVRSHLAAYVQKGAISKFAIPEAERIVFVETLPLTSVGKVDKKKLRDTYQEQHELAFAGSLPKKEGGAAS